MTTTFTPKRMSSGYPLTELHSHLYQFGSVQFVKPFGFWHAQAPDGSMSPPLFTIDNAVTWAQDNGWLIPVDTCPWCSGHGYTRVAGHYFDLMVCRECEGEGINPQQPAQYVGVAS